ncbi:uncharacterized protein LOC113239723 [Hyposmocoma kahamanoa]|uniref:uncharacterized protein LOC113239723 n=1 Tax=Hyposmocoma kahamanoa TaxID=1477025 RepID=UPI000E6D7543|nr:uncharacterized protein LOC113239723 [Hyposmocoma kahamanoa]
MGNIELPHCDRCCCCLPIRHGLIVWAFLKLIFFIPPTAMIAKVIVTYGTMLDISELVWFIGHAALMIINCSVTVFCIVAMFMKRHKLMILYLRYEVITIVINTVALVIISRLHIAHAQDIGHIRFIAMWITFFFIFIGSQVYVALLVKSKLKLMADKECFKFQNNAAEAECTYYGHHDDVKEVVISNNVMPENSDSRDESCHALNKL